MNNSSEEIAPLVAMGVLSATAVALAFWGWIERPDLVGGEGYYRYADAAYLAVKSLTMGEAYDKLADKGSWQLQTARLLGLAAASWAVFRLLMWAFGRSRIRRQARRKKDHIVVVGASAFADALSERVITAGKERLCCVQLRGMSDFENHKGRLIRLPFNGLDPSGLNEAGADQARKIVIATDDDARAVDLALAVQKLHGDNRSVNIVVRMRDVWLAQSLHSVPGGKKLRVFSEAGAAAREILRRHPPYLTAKDLNHQRIHLLLIGDHDWIEALMAEAIMSVCTLSFGKPIFTLCAKKVHDLCLRLEARYPELAKAADITYIEAKNVPYSPLKDDWWKGEEVSPCGEASPAETSRYVSFPVTCAYCAFDTGAYSLAAAVSLRDHAPEFGNFKAPIFARVTGGEILTRRPAGALLAEVELVPFGDMKDITDATGILSATTDEAERRWHQAYRAMNPGDKPANRPWEDLDEEYRISNRRAVAHLYAKLFEAGFDIRSWLKDGRYWDELPVLAADEPLFRNEAERAMLAELEHERWIADRRMLGWAYGPTRNNTRKIHPDMLPFAKLSDETQGYDYSFIDSLNESLLKGNSVKAQRVLKRNSAPL